VQTAKKAPEKEGAMPLQPARPRGFLPIGVFFIFGSIMAAYAATTLLLPGTFLDTLWALNPQGHSELVPFSKIAAPAFMILSASLAATAVGWLRRRYWGWVCGISIIAINATGDVMNLARGEMLKGAVGVAFAGSLLIYMTRPKVRAFFRT
jgi:hypothetical protein